MLNAKYQDTVRIQQLLANNNQSCHAKHVRSIISFHPHNYMKRPALLYSGDRRRLVSERVTVPTLHHVYLHHEAQMFAFSLLGTMWVGGVGASAQALC